MGEIIKTMEYSEIIERTSSIQGYFDQSRMEILYPLIKGLPRGALLVEIGTFHGKSTLFFRLANPEILIITIDVFAPHEKVPRLGRHIYANNIDSNVLKEGNIFSIKGDSREIVKGFNLPIDCLFIDGHHLYGFVKADIENWTPFIRKRRIVIFDDYGAKEHQGVKQAVDEWIKSHKDFAELHSSYLYIAKRL